MFVPLPHPQFTFGVNKYLAFIGGKWTASNQTFTTGIHNAGHLWSEVADCGPKEAELALESAITATSIWATQPIQARLDLIAAWQEKLTRNVRRLANAIASETGKPISQGKQEIAYATGLIDQFLSAAKTTTLDQNSSQPSQNASNKTQSPGPGLVVLSWQSPAYDFVRNTIRLFAEGRSAIVVPAPEAPLSALLLAQYWEEVDSPAGSLQVLTTSSQEEVCQQFIADARIQSMDISGNSKNARALYESAIRKNRSATLDTARPVPYFVFADADIDVAAAIIVETVLGISAQPSVLAPYVYVCASVCAELGDRIVSILDKFHVGNPFEEKTQIGPLLNTATSADLDIYVEDAITSGARLFYRKPRTGLISYPIVLQSEATNVHLSNGRLLGPVLLMSTFDSDRQLRGIADGFSGTPLVHYWSCSGKSMVEMQAKLSDSTFRMNVSRIPSVEEISTMAATDLLARR
ncbi:aldehyde dehydrogenase family protein [Undibacterium terreum]|uniref:aldehyde dehydrogenase family protein n=1 Tax=Undibacterium terreum TaxID=1224302 RepID=UPI001664BB3D|nr:aldehyde dehydrogenase family protein [Undibacterium terreum]